MSTPYKTLEVVHPKKLYKSVILESQKWTLPALLCLIEWGNNGGGGQIRSLVFLKPLGGKGPSCYSIKAVACLSKGVVVVQYIFGS